ncbi:aspartate racemase [Bacillus sp. AFS076308]|uniref:aspartate/glutamate racemase family protein n=1 Tax=unclassified Bacillus (in: firmicutes) TaxID=185979 RepID=UPI000BF949C7|nr:MULTISPECIES: amino acid racemase [unclassified Bacillus (in: firmicutes)]PFN78566.1 aspartate racemase [Bacillus sp. AFS076308]PGV48060.1 aspartate racemase [Bacillus sp. AFS037270]
MKKIVGIIGGMGPLATVDLMNKIIFYTSAKKDQDHIHIIADNYSQIPDRTTAILGKGTDPTPFIIQSAQRLENAGADFLVMACNTAHYYFKSIKKSVNIPILHMPLETAHFLHVNNIRNVGLLATDGTINTKLYQRSCQSYNINVIEPDMQMQKEVMEGIYAIKGSDLEKGRLYLSKVANKLIKRGAEAIIAGCTEIPLVIKSSQDIVIIDPTEILAKSAIKAATETESAEAIG